MEDIILYLKLLDRLKKKAALMKWHSEERKEYYSVIAKKIEGKKDILEMGYFVYDPEDLLIPHIS